MARTSISSAERIKLGHEIRVKLESDKLIPFRVKKEAEDVADYWKNVAWPEPPWPQSSKNSPPNHPFETGQYRDAIRVERKRKRFGMPRYAVVNDAPNANFIEYGTGPDKPGSQSPWGPDTPTPEYAPAAKTAHRFGGTAP